MKKDITLMIVITEMCNLNCIYCYEKHRRPGHIDVGLAKNILSEHLNNDNDYHFINITLFGGEPFLFFDVLKEICEWTWQKSWKVEYMFSFSTNGTLLNDEVKKWIASNKDRLVLTLSADGAEFSQDHNRSGSYTNIDYCFFKDTFDKPMVKMTISKESVRHMAENIIFYHDMGFSFMECNLAEAIDWDEDISIFDEEMSKLLDYYIRNPSIEPAPIMNKDIWRCEAGRIKKKACGIGDYLEVYGVDGLKTPCNMLTKMSFDDEEINMLLSQAFDAESLTDRECFNNCYYYPICNTCYIGDYMQTGKMGLKSRWRCEFVKIQARYIAKLTAIKLLEKDMNFTALSSYEKQILSATVRAIKTISNTH